MDLIAFITLIAFTTQGTPSRFFSGTPSERLLEIASFDPSVYCGGRLFLKGELSLPTFTTLSHNFTTLSHNRYVRIGLDMVWLSIPCQHLVIK